MQSAAQAANAALSNVSKPTSSNDANARPLQQNPPPRLSQHSLDNFWARMAAMFGHSWASQFGESPTGLAGDTWAAALAGITPAQISTGLHATLALGAEFPPSAPHFRALCFGIPSFASLRHEMTHGEVPRTPFGIKAWEFIDPFRMRQADQREADRIARDAYDLAKDFAMRGGELPEVHAALRAPLEPERKPAASPEVARRHIDEILGKLADPPDEGEQA